MSETDEVPVAEAALEARLADVSADAAALRVLLPAELQSLISDTVVRSHKLYEEFVDRLVLRVARETGLEAATREPASAAEVVVRLGLEPRRALVPIDWILRRLTARRTVEEVGAGRRFRSRGVQALPDAAPLREEQQRHDSSWLPSYTLAETVAQDYPAFLRGEIAGEEVLFAPRRLRLWVDYFSNANGQYAVSNHVGAIGVARWLPRAGGVIRGRRRAGERRGGRARASGSRGTDRRRPRVPVHRTCAGVSPARAAGPRGALPGSRVAPVRRPRHESPFRGTGGSAGRPRSGLRRQRLARGARPRVHAWRGPPRPRARWRAHRVGVRPPALGADDLRRVHLQPHGDLPRAALAPGLPPDGRLPHGRRVAGRHRGRRGRRRALRPPHRACARARARLLRGRDRSDPAPLIPQASWAGAGVPPGAPPPLPRDGNGPR